MDGDSNNVLPSASRPPAPHKRGKIQIRRISDNRTRQVTFLKRKNGLLKKAMELGILCDCEVAVIVYNPHNGKLFEYSSISMERILNRYATYSGPTERRKPEQFFDVSAAKGHSNIPVNEPNIAIAAQNASLAASKRPRPTYKFEEEQDSFEVGKKRKLSSGETPTFITPAEGIPIPQIVNQPVSPAIQHIPGEANTRSLDHRSPLQAVPLTQAVQVPHPIPVLPMQYPMDGYVQTPSNSYRTRSAAEPTHLMAHAISQLDFLPQMQNHGRDIQYHPSLEENKSQSAPMAFPIGSHIPVTSAAVHLPSQLYHREVQEQLDRVTSASGGRNQSKSNLSYQNDSDRPTEQQLLSNQTEEVHSRGQSQSDHHRNIMEGEGAQKTQGIQQVSAEIQASGSSNSEFPCSRDPVDYLNIKPVLETPKSNPASTELSHSESSRHHRQVKQTGETPTSGAVHVELSQSKAPQYQPPVNEGAKISILPHKSNPTESQQYSGDKERSNKENMSTENISLSRLENRNESPLQKAVSSVDAKNVSNMNTASIPALSDPLGSIPRLSIPTIPTTPHGQAWALNSLSSNDGSNNVSLTPFFNLDSTSARRRSQNPFAPTPRNAMIPLTPRFFGFDPLSSTRSLLQNPDSTPFARDTNDEQRVEGGGDQKSAEEKG